MSYKMQPVEYSGRLWWLKEPYPTLRDFLISKDRLIEIVYGEPPYHVIIGVPHQAAVGVEQIAENQTVNDRKKSRHSDENAALLALVAFTNLREHNIPCKLVVAAHATDHDPNKTKGSPYWNSIFAADTRLLFECHGAGPERVHALEVAAGQNQVADPLRFGRSLAQALGYQYPLAAQVKPGAKQAIVFGPGGTESNAKLQLAALSTDSLTEAGKRRIPALHLEAKPSFRKPDDNTNTLTEDGLRLGWAIAEAIMAYLEDENAG